MIRWILILAGPYLAALAIAVILFFVLRNALNQRKRTYTIKIRREGKQDNVKFIVGESETYEQAFQRAFAAWQAASRR